MENNKHEDQTGQHRLCPIYCIDYILAYVPQAIKNKTLKSHQVLPNLLPADTP